MKQRITNIITISLVAVLAFAGALSLADGTALALDPGAGINNGVKASGGGGATGLNASIETIINLLLFILGAIAVIMIVIGGIKYTTSNGDASNIKSAKDTILYSVIGLVVALLAYAIVNWVVKAF